MTGLMTIGAFARLGGVSVKVLRFYADEDLLRPAHVDPGTGYRYYRADQLGPLTHLLNLRALGMGLADIRRTLNASDEDQLEALARHEATLLTAKADIEQRLDALGVMREALEDRWARELGPVRLVRTEPRLALIRRRPRTASLESAFEDAERVASQVEGRADRPPFTVWSRDATACVPVVDAATGRLPAREVKWVGRQGWALSWIHTGGYDALEPLTSRLRKSLRGRGPRLRPETLHIYHRFGADQSGYELPPRVIARSADELVTEVQIPIRGPKKEQRSS